MRELRVVGGGGCVLVEEPDTDRSSLNHGIRCDGKIAATLLANGLPLLASRV